MVQIGIQPLRCASNPMQLASPQCQRGMCDRAVPFGKRGGWRRSKARAIILRHLLETDFGSDSPTLCASANATGVFLPQYWPHRTTSVQRTDFSFSPSLPLAKRAIEKKSRTHDVMKVSTTTGLRLHTTTSHTSPAVHMSLPPSQNKTKQTRVGARTFCSHFTHTYSGVLTLLSRPCSVITRNIRYHVAELFEEPTTTEAIYDFLNDRISREVARSAVVLGKEIGARAQLLYLSFYDFVL